MVTRAEKKRGHYLATLTKTNSDKEARAKSGLKSPHTKTRILDRLQHIGTLKDRPRSGRPITITTAAKERAWSLLVDQEQPLLTGKELLVILKDEGLVPDRTTRKTLLKHLEIYVKSLGHQLRRNFTGTIFALKKEDAPARVQFAKELLAVIDHQGLEDVWFEDETTEEEYPHPKGMAQVDTCSVQPTSCLPGTSTTSYAMLDR